MEKQCSRREFIIASILGTIVTQIPTSLVYAITGEESKYPHKTPTKREDLKNIPELYLLSRGVFGEARNCPSIYEKALVAQTAINRLHDGKRYTGQNSITEVLLKQNINKGKLDDQYDCFCDTIPRLRKNFLATLDPIKYDPKSWGKSLAITNIVLNGDYFNQFNQEQTIYVTKNQVKKWEANNSSPQWIKNSKKIDENKMRNSNLYKHYFYKEP